MLLGQTYIFDGPPNLFRNTALIAVRFFVPIWLISATFVFPTCVLFDILTNILISNFSLYWVLTQTIFVWISSYFAAFVIVAEISDICLGGTASFSKAMYKTSVRGIGRLLGTDIIVGVVAIIVVITFEIISVLFSLIFLTNMTWVIPVLLGGIALGGMGAVLVVWLFLFTVQVAAIERTYWFSALRRSASIVLQSNKRSLMVLFLFFGLVVLLQSMLSALILCLSYLIGDLPNITNATSFYSAKQSLMTNVFGSILYTLHMPIPNIFLTLAYYYLRRVEGKLSTREIEDIKAYEMS